MKPTEKPAVLSVHDRLPQIEMRVMVVTEGFRCLGYRDAAGAWVTPSRPFALKDSIPCSVYVNMKTLLFLHALGLAVLQTAHGQQRPPPPVQWQRTIGGMENDILWRIEETRGDGFLLQGPSFSGVGKDRALPNLGGPFPVVPDLWSVTLDAQGRILSQSVSDFAPFLPTADGGVIGRYLNATNKMSPSLGGNDIWLVRLDASGQKVWDRTYGGTGDDRLVSILPAREGGFFVAGTSTSEPGGNKTSPAFGEPDYWVLRLDESGNLRWDKSFGGSQADWLHTVQQTRDGGWILGGISTSFTDGNKTSPQYSLFGTFDAWLVKLDAGGNKLWENSYGGTDADWLQGLLELDEGGFILVGWTFSRPSGNKTSEDTGGWVIRVDDRGQKMWEETFNAAGVTFGFTYLSGIQKTFDDGFIIGGQTQFADGLGGFTTDLYALRLDHAGNKLWDLLYRTGGRDSLAGVQQTRDGGFIIGGSTPTPPVDRPSNDFLVIKLAPEDDDQDGVPNRVDQCPDTAPGDIVDASGCSIQQHCPCAGPWRNHADYVRCVKETAARFETAGLISRSENSRLINTAAQSDCGK